MKQELGVLTVSANEATQRLLAAVFEDLSGARVIDRAPDGMIGLSKLRRLDIDLVILDMAGESLAATFAAIREQNPAVGIIVTGACGNDAALVVQSLQLGALSHIPHPKTADPKGLRDFRLQLLPLIGLLRSRRKDRGPDNGEAGQPRPVARMGQPPPQDLPPTGPDPVPRSVGPAGGAGRRSVRPAKVGALAIAASTGGPNALATLIPSLPVDLGIPIFVVQHMPPVLTTSLAAGLGAKTRLKVKEAADGERVTANVVYIAPGGWHMGVQAGPPGSGPAASVLIRLSGDPPENGVRPAADVLLRSLVPLYGANVLVAILTGMGSDGLNGVKTLKQLGCYCLTQSQASCVVYGMPRAVDEAGFSDERVPLETLGARIAQIVRGG